MAFSDYFCPSCNFNRCFFDCEKRAKVLAESTSKYAHLIAHQLLTPLSVIRWSAELMEKKENLTQDEKEILANIHENDLHMITTISDILTIVDVKNQHIKTENESVDIIDLIHIVIKNFTTIAQKKNLNITFNNETKKSVLNLHYDREKLKRILSGLVENSISYNDKKGDIVLTLSSENQCVVFSVQDNGIGIPRKEWPNIPNKLFRGSNAGAYQQHGLGLTLFMIQQLVEICGGKLWFESEENKGSTFFIRILM